MHYAFGDANVALSALQKKTVYVLRCCRLPAAGELVPVPAVCTRFEEAARSERRFQCMPDLAARPRVQGVGRFVRDVLDGSISCSTQRPRP